MQRITGGDRYLVVTDATGNSGSMSQALQFVAQSGRLVYVGITTGEVTFPHPWMHRPEMTLLGSRNAMPADFRRIIRLIEEGTINTAPWITHHVDFEDLVRDFEQFTRPETRALKAVVHVT
jgi:alcohol dehydrogenase